MTVLIRILESLLLVLLCSVVAHAANLKDPTRPFYYQAEKVAQNHPVSKHVLSAIIVNHDRRLAMVDGKLVKQGDQVGEAKVVFIGSGIVQLEGVGGRITLFLPGESVRRPVDADSSGTQGSGE